MPWKRDALASPYYAFIASVWDRGSSFADVCRAHGISRPTGYKWFKRFLQQGLEGLREQSRRPHRCARQTADEVRTALFELRQQHPTWGAKKLVAVLADRWPRQSMPHPRTVERWSPRGARPARRVCLPALRPLRARVRRCHDVWTIDFKGWFRTQDRRRCEPLTVRDAYSCCVLYVRHVSAESTVAVRRALTGLFQREGLPRVIRVDNGAPFGGTGALGLTRLSVWWLQLGIAVEFSRPGHPEDNAAHEQMHRVLKAETANPPAPTLAAQNRRLERWRQQYNRERPHEAFGQRPPQERYQRNPRRYPRTVVAWRYPAGVTIRRVSQGGWISWAGRRRLIGRAFAQHAVGLKPRGTYHLVWLGPHCIGELHPTDQGGLRPFRHVSH
jgi:putative transposase